MTKKRDKVKPDAELKSFWRDNERFADLCNAVLFQGIKTIRAEDLQELDTDLSGIIFSEENRESILRTRDVVKKMAYGMEFLIVGIENQMNVHYAMPLRVLLYDSLGYLKQCEEIKTTRKESKEAQRADEFLSEFGKQDKLTPIITIVIYYGASPWDGPFSIHDMLDNIPKSIKKLVSNQQMNLVEIVGDTEYIFHSEEVKLFFLLSKAFLMKDKEAVIKITKEQPLKLELAEAIGKVINSNKLIDYVEKKEGFDMCELFEDIRAEGKAVGIAEGKAVGIAEGKAVGVAEGKIIGKAEGIVGVLRSLNWEPTEILNQLMNDLGFSEAEGRKFL